MNFLIIDIENKLGETFTKFFPKEHTVHYNNFQNINYDAIFIECDFCKLNDELSWSRWWRGWGNKPEENHLSDSNLQFMTWGSPKNYSDRYHKIFKLLNDIKHEKCVIIDLNDRAIVSPGLDWIKSNNYKVHTVLKREYRRTHLWDYDNTIKSFPFMTFDKKSRDILYDSTEYSTINNAGKGCFFIGDALFRVEIGMSDEWVNRFDFLKICEKLGCLNWYRERLSHEEYLNLYKKHNTFLHLNGTGHLCGRFFEGLGKGSLCILQENDVIFPFKNPVHESLVIKHPTQLEKIMKNLTNSDYYKECFDHQVSTIKQYYNREYVFSYILNNI